MYRELSGEAEEFSEDQDKYLLRIKIVILFSMLIAGTFVFLPFSSFFKEGEPE